MLTVEEAKQAMRTGAAVVLVDEDGRHPDPWYTIHSLSDDESLAYCKPYGLGWLSSAIMLKYLELKGAEI